MTSLGRVLITGGTGSFGYEFVKTALARDLVSQVIVYSRDEMKQIDMMACFANDPRMRFFLGDVRDLERLKLAMNGVDTVIHAAAQKIVPLAEYNPFECVKTNVIGAMNIIEAALSRGVARTIALSTDKASSPINLYGATKLASDKLFCNAGVYSGSDQPKFGVVRYGNVMGSRGSVLPFYRDILKSGGRTLPITDVRMSRFMIQLSEAVELVLMMLDTFQGGETYVKKIPSIKLVDIVEAFGVDIDFEIIGVRPGEKLHEEMICREDSYRTYDCGDHFRIYPSISNYEVGSVGEKHGTKVADNFVYRSNRNTSWMSSSDLKKWLKDNYGE